MKNNLLEVWWTSDDDMWVIESHWKAEIEKGRLEGFEYPPKAFFLNGIAVNPDCVADSIIDDILDTAREELYEKPK